MFQMLGYLGYLRYLRYNCKWENVIEGLWAL